MNLRSAEQRSYCQGVLESGETDFYLGMTSSKCLVYVCSVLSPRKMSEEGAS